ncbi:MAG: hypothetical protein IT204_14025 [Fimbriimonadaceae bacterium]|nr:hypothetical protein [Fimbriimonadaceae bacterium]
MPGPGHFLLLLLLGALAWLGRLLTVKLLAREGLRERFGGLPADLVARCQGREVVWVHAVSLGETIAARPLLAELRQRRPGAVLLLSHWTETGREAALAAGAEGLFYSPLDLPWVVRRVLRQLRPALLVTIDTEFWPNLYRLSAAAGVALACANGRISDKSFGRIQRWRVAWFYRWVLRFPDRLLMQSAEDAARAVRLGAPGARVTVAGNLKFDEAHPVVSAERLQQWRTILGLQPAEPVLLAGSTGPGEEEVLLAAWQALRPQFPTLRLVLVPRHIDRAAEILARIAALGAVGLRRSELPARAAESGAARAVIVGDTTGELGELYAVATVAFVGRSLVNLGGSNVLQAAAQGKPVLSGPFVQNVRDSVRLLCEGGVAQIVRDAAELQAVAAGWLGDAAELERLADRARELVVANRGATARTAQALVELLDAR